MTGLLRSEPVRGRRSRARPADVVTGKLKVHDPFELIRWLAMSQPDPRKALAELVQNSLDAGAKTVRITRAREKGTPLVRIFDDGVGVIPELERAEALSYLATHVGHSRKRALSPAERLQLMTQGQYGIGLLGFWSLGETLEIRTSLAGQRPHRLVLYRDRPDYLIEPLRGTLALDETYTEVVVAGLHREAVSAVLGSRIADYLAAELRGQLLERGVDLTVDDRISRGRSRKLIAVRPPRFLGERLEAFSRLDVEGHAPARLEIYLRGDEAPIPASEASTAARPGLAVYAAGTLVAETFHDLSALQLDREPWTDGRLTGLVDFPALRVAPGSRRGVVPDEAAGAFAAALAHVEPALVAVLEAAERRREEQLEKGIVKELQRAFRDFFRHRPRYSSLPTEPGRSDAGGDDRAPESSPAEGTEAGLPDRPPEAGQETATGDDPSLEETAGSQRSDEPVFLFPPGPLASLEIVPPRLKIPAGTRRRLSARPLDESGRDVEDDVSVEWSASPGVGTFELVGSSRSVVLIAGVDPVVGWLRALARSAGRIAEARADVEVSDPPNPPGMGEGIPQPELVDAPGAAWRSRLEGGRWQVNSGHRDYRLLSGKAVVKLRYLALLFAKEVVLRSSSDPRLADPLEQLVEVAAYADRHIRRKGTG